VPDHLELYDSITARRDLGFHTYSRGERPSNSPARSLARRWRRRAPFAWLARVASRSVGSIRR
jgi:hypothetical protein